MGLAISKWMISQSVINLDSYSKKHTNIYLDQRETLKSAEDYIIPNKYYPQKINIVEEYMNHRDYCKNLIEKEIVNNIIYPLNEEDSSSSPLSPNYNTSSSSLSSSPTLSSSTSSPSLPSKSRIRSSFVSFSTFFT